MCAFLKNALMFTRLMNGRLHTQLQNIINKYKYNYINKYFCYSVIQSEKNSLFNAL